MTHKFELIPAIGVNEKGVKENFKSLYCIGCKRSIATFDKKYQSRSDFIEKVVQFKTHHKKVFGDSK